MLACEHAGEHVRWEDLWDHEFMDFLDPAGAASLVAGIVAAHMCEHDFM